MYLWFQLLGRLRPEKLVRPGAKGQPKQHRIILSQKGCMYIQIETLSMVLFDDMIESSSYHEETYSLCEINMYSYVHKPFEFQLAFLGQY